MARGELHHNYLPISSGLINVHFWLKIILDFRENIVDYTYFVMRLATTIDFALSVERSRTKYDRFGCLRESRVGCITRADVQENLKQK